MDQEFQWMPEQASSIAADVDRLYGFLLLVSGVMTVLIAIAIFFFAIKYRRGSKADRTQGHGHFFALEVTWITIPFLVMMVMFFWGARLYFIQIRPPAGAMQIDCVGRQWMWKFQHPEGNSEINDLHVPLGQPIKLHMISEDVIHSMYVPAFRVKQDVLPGRYTTIWFTPTKVGRYHLFCAEYCGTKHSEMKGFVHVMEPSKFQEWLAGDTSPSAAAEGAKLFEQHRCNTCHLGGGQLGRGPSLEGLFGKTVRLQNGDTVVVDETYIRESILRPAHKVVAGYQSIMPSYEGQISEQGIMQLIAEIKSMGQVDEQPAATSGQGGKGQGGAGPATDEGNRGKADPNGKRAPGEPDSDQPPTEQKNTRPETNEGGNSKETESKS